ncbi:MAG TPA: M20/M25/M40 family metallo-hydrolase [Candidatus Krumholzibacteria bacterium]|nr:M20/M25/M40 family metallo-hydrolase [Candidatus Krumholzibacteria bacterium]
MLRAGRPRLASSSTTWIRCTPWCFALFVLTVAATGKASAQETDYLDLREKLESSRETLRQSVAKYVRAADAEEFPDDKPGKVFRAYLTAALTAVAAKRDFPAIHAAFAKWSGQLDPANDTQRRALGVFLGDYLSVRYGTDLVRELRNLVKFKTYHSVISDNTDNPEFQHALDSLAGLAKGLGLEVVRHGNESLEIRLAGKSKAGTPPVAVYTHVEVMRPVDYKWDTDTPPFDLNLKDGRWIGCGAYGDKGPLLVNLFALRTLRDAGLALARPVVLIVGTTMSTPDASIATSLSQLAPAPGVVLAADGIFPYADGQMGNLVARVSSRRGMKSTTGLKPEMFYIYRITAYWSMNTVPAETRAWVLYKDPVDSINPSLDMVTKWRGIIEPHQTTIPVSRYGTYVQEDTLHFFSYTLPSHVESATGRNAIMDMASALAKVPMLRNSAFDIVQFLDRGLQSDPTGKAAGLFYEDARMGTPRINPVQFDRIGEEVAVLIDVRFPVGHDRPWIRARFEELVAKFNREHDAKLVLAWETEGREPVQNAPPPQVRDWLVDAYELASGDIGAEVQPIARSAGNVVPFAIPFGPERPGVDKHGQTQHESISERELSDLGVAYCAALAWLASAANVP